MNSYVFIVWGGESGHTHTHTRTHAHTHTHTHIHTHTHTHTNFPDESKFHNQVCMQHLMQTYWFVGQISKLQGNVC